jgi:hypothetical protein
VALDQLPHVTVLIPADHMSIWMWRPCLSGAHLLANVLTITPPGEMAGVVPVESPATSGFESVEVAARQEEIVDRIALDKEGRGERQALDAPALTGQERQRAVGLKP